MKTLCPCVNPGAFPGLLLLALIGLFLGACAVAPVPSPSPLPGSRWNPTCDVGAELWNSKVSGNILHDADTGTKGTKLDLPGNLGYDRKERLLSYFIKYYLNQDWHLDLDYMQLGHSGSGYNARTLVSGPVDTSQSGVSKFNLYSDLDVQLVSLKVSRDFHAFTRFSYGFSGGLLSTEGDYSLLGALANNPSNTRDDSEDWRAFFPVVGAYGAYDTRTGWRFAAEGTLTHMKFFGDKTTYLDGNATVSYFFGDNFSVFAGYRYLNLASDVEEVELQYRMLGPVLGFWFRF